MNQLNPRQRQLHINKIIEFVNLLSQPLSEIPKLFRK